MTIDELARHAGSTTRNIRNYQTARLLPAPDIEGRVAFYGAGHLARLRLIAGLQQRGFSLAGIGQLLTAWEQGRGLAEVLGFEEALTQPWSDEEPQLMTVEELLALFPEAATDPTHTQRSLGLGLIELEGEMVRIPHPRLLRAGAELVAAGIPLAAVHEQLEALRADMDRVALRFVALFEEHVWTPFAEAGLPAAGLAAVTDAMRRLRPVAITSVNSVLATAMDHRIALSMGAHASEGLP